MVEVSIESRLLIHMAYANDLQVAAESQAFEQR